jgi:hypothetical protein
MIDEKFEARVADHRSKTRQNKEVPFLIRDDGALFPNVPLLAAKPRFRPYHGKLGAPLEERLAYLAGQPGRRRTVVMSAPINDEPFDIAKASKDEIIKFAEEEFGEIIDPALHLNKIRAMVAKLAGVDPVRAQRVLPEDQGGDMPAGAEG